MAGKADTEGEGAGLEAFGARDLSVYVPELNGDLHFFVFETKCGSASMADCVAPSLGLERAPPLGRYIEDLITFLSRHWATAHQKNGGTLPQIVLRATGGGAHKHAAAFRRVGLVLDIGEEMGCIVSGLNFLLHSVQVRPTPQANAARAFTGAVLFRARSSRLARPSRPSPRQPRVSSSRATTAR